MKIDFYVYQAIQRQNLEGVATRYGLDGLGIESQWGRQIFCTRPNRSWSPSSLLYNGCRVTSAGKWAGAWR
jgi:hypothetical protein